MAEYVNLNGIQTWYDVHGAGDPLVVLHPGGVGVDSRAFGPNLAALAEHFRVYLPERRGHGHTPDAPGDYSYALMAQDTVTFLEQVVGAPVRLLGVSDGAVVALLTTLQRPDLVTRLVCVAGVFHNSGWVPSAIAPTDEPPSFLIESYAEVSPDGPAHYKIVHRKLDEMHMQGPKLTPADLGKIECRTLVMVGDDDEVILEHAAEFYRALTKGEFAVIPGTSHGLMAEKPHLCNQIILDFLMNDPVETFAPIRRATA